MFGVQVRRILGSSLAQGANAGATAGALSGAAPMGAEWQKIVSLAGFDPFKDIDEVLIASTGEGEPAHAPDRPRQFQPRTLLR